MNLTAAGHHYAVWPERLSNPDAKHSLGKVQSIWGEDTLISSGKSSRRMPVGDFPLGRIEFAAAEIVAEAGTLGCSGRRQSQANQYKPLIGKPDDHRDSIGRIMIFLSPAPMADYVGMHWL
ncbi:MAG: hypothetical protein LAN63_07305 [Acidobacteriia bacterium]|nr:hypothetical protein [Terriglobia bacterium]